ncbi:MAG: PP2C family protein-serine/threonine phosphatase [bacterium]
MLREQSVRNVVFALLGIVFILTYFAVLSNSRLVKLLQPRQPRDDVLEKAEQLYHKSALAHYQLKPKTTLTVDDELLQYAQLRANSDSARNRLTLGQWEIAWQGKTKTKKGEPQSVRFVLTYDLNGRLIGLKQSAPELIKLPNLKEEEAILKAKSFLAAFAVDTTALKLTRKRINKEDDILNYEFTFAAPFSFAPDLSKTIAVEISGKEVTSFKTSMSLQEDDFLTSKAEKVGKIAATSTTVIVWIAAALFLVVLFFKRLKHDELEFKRALWLGLTAFVLMWVNVAIASRFEWQGALIGGGFAGLFTGGGLLIVYSVSESLARDVWPEKIASLDLICRGYVRFREVGVAILNSFSVAGSILLYFAIFIWLSSHFDLGYLAVNKDDSLWLFDDKLAMVANVSQNLVTVLFISLTLVVFGASYLRSKFQDAKAFVAVFAFLLDFAGLHYIYLRPTYLAFFLVLPLAAYSAYVIYKYDFVTTFLALLIFYTLLDLSLISLLPSGFSSLPGVTTGVFMVFMFAGGIYLNFSKSSLKDFEDYVPEYVSRIAERERFLQELEIARNVQMKFLPQSLPNFPELEIASICRPAMEVGGDYYDFIRDGNASLSIIIGDVSGKGVSAAFYMTMAKGIIKTLSKTIRAPKKLLTEMNAIFYENAPRDVFISVIYGVFDMQNRTLTFARAGHNPLIVRKKIVGEAELLQPNGLAIGLEKGHMFSSTIQEEIIAIEADDVFVFFTDGISESMNKDGDEYGEDRLGQIISQNAHCSAQELVQKVTENVSTFAGTTRQHDDFTMVVVKVASGNSTHETHPISS